MKSFLILFSIVLSSQAMSSEVLLKLSKGSGFGPIPRSSTLIVTELGQVTLLSSERRLVRKTEIAKLSKEAIESLKEKIETIDDAGILKNLDEKKPRCMDAPSTNLTVNKGGKEIVISAIRSCQRFQTSDLETNALTSLMQSFNYLTK
jgi:hypothetical protein